MKSSKKVRFAVVGFGHIAQIAVLPAFKNASEKCEFDAIREAAKTGRSVKIKTDPKVSKPGKELVEEKPGVEKPELVNVQSGSR